MWYMIDQTKKSALAQRRADTQRRNCQQIMIYSINISILYKLSKVYYALLVMPNFIVQSQFITSMIQQIRNP
jgi:hypothetical protein